MNSLMAWPAFRDVPYAPSAVAWQHTFGRQCLQIRFIRVDVP